MYYVVRTYILFFAIRVVPETVSSRKFVTIPERLLVDIIKVAERMGVPYVTLIERILSTVVPILRYKRNLLDSLALVDAFDDIRRLGGMVLPQQVLKEILPYVGPEKMERLCRELGRLATWFGELSRVKRPVTLGEIRNTISLWIPSASVDVVKEGDGSTFKYVLSLNDPSEELMWLARCVVEGLMKGYDVKEYEVSVGGSALVIRVSGVHEE